MCKVEAVLRKSGKQASVKRIWNGTIKEIALYMGENGTERNSRKQAITIAAKQFLKGKKILSLLEKYWLVTQGASL